MPGRVRAEVNGHARDHVSNKLFTVLLQSDGMERLYFIITFGWAWKGARACGCTQAPLYLKNGSTLVTNGSFSAAG